jgi:cytochrome b involved in lipid metabolism
VYDVTDWAPSHPGGEEVLQEYYGSDASMEFSAVGHSTAAKAMLLPLLVGKMAASDHISV